MLQFGFFLQTIQQTNMTWHIFLFWKQSHVSYIIISGAIHYLII